MNTAAISPEVWATAVGDVLGHPLNAREETWLGSSGHLDNLASGRATLDAVAADVRKARATWGTGPLVEEPGNAPLLLDPEAPLAADLGQARMQTLSRLVALDAENRDIVRIIRQGLLGGKTLAYADVGMWIQRMSEQDGPPAVWETRARSDGARLYDDDGRLILLRYGIPGEKWQRHQPIAARGVLWLLWLASERFARLYSWSEAQSTVFLVTGLVPVLQGSTVRIVLNRIPSLSRAELTIDPLQTPAEVASTYREARQQVLASQNREQHREMSRKHLHLALFAAERPEDESWRESMERWNTRHPEWEYGRLDLFSRDTQQAYWRVAGVQLSALTSREMADMRDNMWMGIAAYLDEWEQERQQRNTEGEQQKRA